MAEVTLDVSVPVEVLQMSPTAAYLCLTILLCLTAISVLLAIASLRHQHLLLQPIESIADVALLVAGSEKLLEHLRNPHVSDDELRDADAYRMKLGWFTSKDGTSRWGIELASAGTSSDVQREEEEEASSPPSENHKARPPPEARALLPHPDSPGENKGRNLREETRPADKRALLPHLDSPGEDEGTPVREETRPPEARALLPHLDSPGADEGTSLRDAIQAVGRKNSG